MCSEQRRELCQVFYSVYRFFLVILQTFLPRVFYSEFGLCFSDPGFDWEIFLGIISSHVIINDVNRDFSDDLEHQTDLTLEHC